MDLTPTVSATQKNNTIHKQCATVLNIYPTEERGKGIHSVLPLAAAGCCVSENRAAVNVIYPQLHSKAQLDSLCLSIFKNVPECWYVYYLLKKGPVSFLLTILIQVGSYTWNEINSKRNCSWMWVNSIWSLITCLCQRRMHHYILYLISFGRMVSFWVATDLFTFLFVAQSCCNIRQTQVWLLLSLLNSSL